MGVHEVLVAKSLKDGLTHACPKVAKGDSNWKQIVESGDHKKRIVTVPFGSKCTNYGDKDGQCKFENPPGWSSVIMTDGQIEDFKERHGEKFIKVVD